MEGRTENFTPGDNFTHQGKKFTPGDNWGQSLPLGEKLRMGLRGRFIEHEFCFLI
jgi:hypothetical protein